MVADLRGVRQTQQTHTHSYTPTVEWILSCL